MARPAGYEWLALGLLTDPIPGDTEGISQEVRHLSSVASMIAAQIDALHRIASDGTEIGRHADTLRLASRDLARSMELVAARYRRVTSALKAWISELEDAQARSLAALNGAQIPYANLKRATAAGDQAAAQRAELELDAAKAHLAKVIDSRDAAAARCAATINTACHDSLTDSLWERFEADISDIAWLIKDTCEVLEIVAGIAALAALWVTGVDFLLLIALAATATATTGRTLLAATGNGSWLDVGLDVVGLVTIGEGVRALDSADHLLHEGVQAGDKLVEAERTEALSRQAAGMFDKTSAFMNETRSAPDSLAHAAETASIPVQDYGPELRPLASTLVKDVTEESSWQRAFAGGEGSANIAARVRVLAEHFPESDDISQLSEQISRELTRFKLHAFGGLGTGVGGSVLSGFPVYEPDGHHLQAYNLGFWDDLERKLSTGHAEFTVVSTKLP